MTTAASEHESPGAPDVDVGAGLTGQARGGGLWLGGVGSFSDVCEVEAQAGDEHIEFARTRNRR